MLREPLRWRAGEARGRFRGIIGLARLALGSVLFWGLGSMVAADVLERHWREHVSEHFRLVTDLDDEQAAIRIRELEMFRSVVLTITGGRASAADERIQVLVFARSRDFAQVFGSDFAGFFVATLRDSRMVSGAGSVGLNAREILFHEYVHHLLRNASSAHYPPWYNEGLAEMLSTVQERKGRIVIGAAPERAQGGRLVHLPMSTLLHGSASDMPPAIANEFYACAWELVHYLHAGHLVGSPNRFEQMTGYLAQIQSGADSEAAFATAFDVSTVQLQREVERYLERGRMPALQYPLEAFRWNDSTTSADLRLEQVAYEVASVAVHVDEERARRLLERALGRLPPDDPRGARLMAIQATAMSRQGEHSAGVSVGRRAVALAPDDPVPRAELADLLFAWCGQTQAPRDCATLLSEAERLYVDGLRLAPQDAELRFGLARLHSRTGYEHDRAAAVLLELANSRPWSAELNLEAGRALAGAGRRSEARERLLRAYNFSHDESTRAQAAALLQTLEPPPATDAGPSGGETLQDS